MKTISTLKAFCVHLLLAVLILLSGHASIAQLSSKSLLINHGLSACGSGSAQQQFLSGTLTNSPTLIATCSNGLSANNVLAAYNPSDHKVYYASLSSTATKVYVADYNFSGAFNCQSLSTPTYTYNYSLNQLCFDNQGNNYVIYNFNATAGTARLTQIDMATGNQIPGKDKQINFPAGNIPNSVDYGDIVILSNGRMFATFGNNPSKLYEITNVNGTGDATAVFLTNLPRPTFAIGFVDGSLTVAGSDANGCYYYIWDIDALTLSNASSFPLGKSSNDMSNLTLAVGCTKSLLASNMINSNTADLYYQVVVKNKGNMFLNNVQVTDDLGQLFGSGNISNLSVSFASNPANLTLNPSFDGVNDINLLTPGQLLNNYPASIDSIVINISFRATQLTNGKIYYNSAVATGSIGSGTNYMAVTDSSNNGGADQMDPNYNGVSDDIGENYPTPFVFNATLAMSGIQLQGTTRNSDILLNWNELKDEQVSSYELQRSFDGHSFRTIYKEAAASESSKTFRDEPVWSQQKDLFYRVIATTWNGKAIYSNVVVVNTQEQVELNSFPNPATSSVSIQLRTQTGGATRITLYDLYGRVVLQKLFSCSPGLNQIRMDDLGKLSSGTYLLTSELNGRIQKSKLIKK